MKDKLTIATTPALLIITALAIFFESPFLLGIAFVGFCIDGVLDKVLLNALKNSSTSQALQIEELTSKLEYLSGDADRRFRLFGETVADLQDQLAVKKSDE